MNYSMILSPKNIFSYLSRRKRVLQDMRKQLPKQHLNANSCIIGNAIPKSGTYLLNSIFKYLGLWQDIGVHVLSDHYILFGNHDSNQDTPRIYRPAIKTLSALHNGQLVAAHLQWNSELSKLLANKINLKHVFMYRDPRDAAVSYMRFVTYADNFLHDEHTRMERKFMLNEFSNDDERLTFVIKKVLINGTIGEYYNWLNDPNTYCIRFEDLYQNIVSLGDSEFNGVLEQLLIFLGINPKLYDPIEFKKGVLHKGYTSTGKKQKYKIYKEYFKDSHYEQLRSSGFYDVIERYGYPLD